MLMIPDVAGLGVAANLQYVRESGFCGRAGPGGRVHLLHFASPVTDFAIRTTVSPTTNKGQFLPLVLKQLVQRLRRHDKPIRNHGKATRRAAVAIVLHELEGEVCLLMIRRAQRAGDPWSGHMAFPGGRRDPEDRDDRSCAIRETREEIALDLDLLGNEICSLSDVNTGWRADRPEMLVAPFVFTVDQLPQLQPNYEVDSVVSVPLAFLLDRGNRVPLKWEWRGTQVESDSYLYHEHRIWGLSLMMIDELIEAAER